MTNNVGLVCCYGFVGTQYGRSVLEMYGLSDYVNEILNFSPPKSNKINLLILCGGKTRPDYPELSEAQTTLEEFGDQFSWTPTQVLLEEESTTTHGNIINGFAKLVKDVDNKTIEFDYENDTIFIFCDRFREWKVKFIAWILFRGLGISYKVVACNRKDTNPKSSLLFQSTAGLILTLKDSAFLSSVRSARLRYNLISNRMREIIG